MGLKVDNRHCAGLIPLGFFLFSVCFVWCCCVNNGSFFHDVKVDNTTLFCRYFTFVLL